MTLSPADAVTICERASSLADRLSGAFAPKDEHSAQGEQFLSIWQQTAAADDPKRLVALGAAMGMRNRVALAAHLGPVRLLPGQSLPPWTTFLAEIVEAITTAFTAASGALPAEDLRPPTRMSDVPFWSLYRPIVDLARARVTSAEPTAVDFLDERAWTNLQCLLLHRISAIASTALQVAFVAHQAITASGIAGLFNVDSQKQERASGQNQPRYAHFIKEEGRTGLRMFFLRYPVAGRLVAESALSWIDAAKEFLRRLLRDKDELTNRFNGGTPLTCAIHIQGGLSDPHNGGRNVLVVTFRGGLRLVYKPRSLRMDVLYFALVAKLNTHLPGLNLHNFAVLDRDDYGWTEFVRHAPCPSKAAARRFYQRAGCLVALTHWLQGIDLHRENLVAAGEQPVLIDLESLAHPLSREEDAFTREHGADSLALSPLRSGLLPLWQAPFGKEVFYDSSALGAPETQRALLPTVRWRHVNTDRVTWEYACGAYHHRGHRPRLDGHLLDPRHFTTDILRGYRVMVTLLSGDKAHEFVARREEINRTVRRRIKRPTPVYALLLRQSLQPTQLTSGVLRSIRLQALPCAAGDEAEWALEVASLERLDVPYFTHADPVQFSRLPLCFTQPAGTRWMKQITAAVCRSLRLENGRVRSMSDPSLRRSRSKVLRRREATAANA